VACRLHEVAGVQARQRLGLGGREPETHQAALTPLVHVRLQVLHPFPSALYRGGRPLTGGQEHEGVVDVGGQSGRARQRLMATLDGPAEVHNSIRGVAGAFEATAAGIASLLDLDPNFRISARCTVQRSNFRRLRDTVDAAQSLHLNSVSFLAADLDSTAFARPVGWPLDKKAAVGLDSAEITVLESEIEALISLGECGHFVCESPAKLRRLALHFRAVLGEKPAVAPACNAPWNSAVVEADGTVRPCFFHRPIGHLSSGKTLDQILNGTEAVAFRDSLDVATNPVCQKCVCSLNWSGA